MDVLFRKLNKDLPYLRSIMHEECGLSIIGSSKSATFEQITNHDKPFYWGFETVEIK